MTGRRALPRSVWLLGWVSLATDAASEAIYPLLPFFLTQVLGAGALSLGIVEGAAEATNSLLKVISGRWADRSATKRPLVLAGYSLSSLVRPLIALASSWLHVFAIRFADRLGKGIRGAPRDAMLATLAPPGQRGQVYGFHRGMDHAGAVAGPVLASLFLLLFPGQYRALFALTIVPGAIAVALILAVREPHADSAARAPHDAGGGSSRLPSELKRFLAIVTLFTLGNSTDAYLLLRLTDTAGGPTYIPMAWAALHVVKSLSSFVGGTWSDRAGRVRVIAAGWTIYAIVYFGFAFSTSLTPLVGWFLVYGLFFGLTEGVEKALVADLAPADRRGFAFGVLTAVQGLGALAASLLFGLLWTTYGPAAAFVTGGCLALVSTGALVTVSTTSAPTDGVRAL